MPKQIYEISNFDAGIVANPNDELDTPPNSASVSLNIDPLVSGELAGVPTDAFLKQSGFKSTYSVVSYTAPALLQTYNPVTIAQNTQNHQTN